MLTETVKNTIKEYSMIRNGDRIVVGLSGGADSVCLICLLSSLKDELDISLEAVHINHCIRGKESDEDEAFCVLLCKKLDIPISTYRIDIPSAAEKSGRSIEETARDIRYEKFSECAGSGKIATAHTLSDNAETVIFNLTRGTGIKGLCGIPPVRDNIIRPLSHVTREQIEEYLTQIGQEYKTDSTNLSDDYTRNKIRHRILPVMLEINKGFFRSFANGQNAVREENTFIDELAQKEYSAHFYNDRLVNLQELAPVIRKRIISRFLNDNNLPVSYDKINAVSELCEKKGRLNITKDTFIISRNDTVSIEKKQDIPNNIECPLKIGINRIFANKTLTARKNTDGKFLIDMDKVSGSIVLHSRRYGDKIKLSGRSFTSSVKKLLNENVSAEKRPFIQFLSDDEGVIFMEGFGVAERVRADETTQNILSVIPQEN